MKPVPVTQEGFAGKGWRRPTGYSFAANEVIVPLVGVEFSRAALTMPIAFVKQSGTYVAVAVMSPTKGRNFYIAAGGQWLGGYLPARLRVHPFMLARLKDTEKVALCIDRESPLVVDADGASEKFFEADGGLSAAVKAIFKVLQQIEQSRAATATAVATLADAGLIQPWQLTVKIGEQQYAPQGLHRVDEAKLASLDDAAFLKLRKSGALVLAYAHLLSLQNVERFANLALLQQQLAPAPLPLPSSLFTGDDSGTIRFD